MISIHLDPRSHQETMPYLLYLPWSARDVTRLTRLTGVGALALGVGWYGASGEAREVDQLRWLTLAIAATALAALGMVGWLVTGFRNVRIAARALSADIGLECGAWELDPIAPVSDPGTRVSSAVMTRYHFPSCQLVQGKEGLFELQPTDIVQRQLTPCGVCVDV